MYFVYVIQSLTDKSWYIGYTSNLTCRLSQHNSGKSRYTNQHGQYKLVCYFAIPNKNDAKRYEKYLKSGWGRRSLKKMLGEYLKAL